MSAPRLENPSYSSVGSKRAGVAAIPAGLYLIPTPIGNLRDITLRALDVLAAADLIACEDTRVTRKLLSALGIPAPTLWTYNGHGAASVDEALLGRVAAGAVVAVVSDAGTPLISDPGQRLVTTAAARGVTTTALPGASAPLPALALSGLPTGRFAFLGFLPPRPAARRRALRDSAALPMTLVFFEAPHRVAAALADMAAELGDRAAAVCRELSKLHEEILRAPLPELAETLGGRERIRGEVVIVVAGATESGRGRRAPAREPAAAAALDERLRKALAEGGVKEAAARVATALGISKREAYRRALALRHGAVAELSDG